MMSVKSFVLAGLVGAMMPSLAAAGGIYGEYDDIQMTDKEKQGVVGALTILIFILMASEVTGPEVLFLIALMVVTLLQIITLQDALSGKPMPPLLVALSSSVCAGFANESMITIGTLFLVVGAVEKSHVVDWLARKTFGSDGSLLFGKIRMYVTCYALSIFFNNTPLVAILLPVVKDWARMRGIAASQLLIPLSYSVLAGSFGSMIGTSTNLTVQGLMEDDRGYSFDFFAPAPFGIVCFVVLLVYQIIAGPYLLPNNKSGLIREARDKAETLIAEVYVSQHSLAVGKSLGEMMNSLGVAPSAAIKIRRRLTNRYSDAAASTPEGETPPLRKSRSSVILDKEYLKKQAEFWLTKPNIPDRMEYQTSSAKAAAAAEEVDLEQQALEFHDLIAPSYHEPICAEDVVFISSAQDAVEKMMKSIMGESRGMFILKSNVMALPGFGTEVLEMVVSDSNPFLGKKLKDITADFSERYSAGLITVRAKDWNMSGEADEKNSVEDGGNEGHATGATALVPSDDPAGGIELTQVNGSNGSVDDQQRKSLVHEQHAKVSISDHVLAYGDVVLVVTNTKQVEKLSHDRDFFVVSTVGSLPKPLTFYGLIPLFLFAALLCIVASEFIEMCPAALTLTAVYFMGGWIKPDDIPKMVDIRLLMLMGCSLSFARAMTKSGLALEIAGSINDANPSNFGALLLVYVITLVITELISNNAAAALMYPIAVALADEMGISFKPFAMAVLISSTAGFMSPIGYQTHVMVWGPGGYRFKDFIIFGLVPNMIYWFIGCSLIPTVFPF